MDNTKLATNKSLLGKRLSLPDQVCKNLFIKVLSQIKRGRLVMHHAGESHEFGKAGSDIDAEIHIHQNSVFSDFVLGGSLGCGESYIRGEWTSNNLTEFIRLFAVNMDVVDKIDGFLPRLINPFLRGLHWLSRNTRSGSRKNIEAHYDLGNDFFELFLDETMMYSSAIYPKSDSSLFEAQQHKLKVICDKLQLSNQDHLLEIGTGWGALAIYAAEHYDCKVTTTTLSQEQYNKAVERVKEKKLEDKITVLMQDYRDLDGQFDKLVSIEMIEAVGHEYLPNYFESCSSLLKEDGLFLMQVITIPDQRYDSARKEVDFIKRYIFPGSCIPSVERVMSCVKSESDMRLLDHRDYTGDYERTLNAWGKNLQDHRSQIKDMAGEDFLRMWEMYFAYCEGGFSERVIGVAQMVFAKPHNKSELR
ncbi:Cyclopropane-fatty-acyl-phospholipid synthase [Lentisphaera araneosa HTCC2155]|uniref:Cyclopropane-fatty-acyl-phospholipid synthase n=1 Tax=Lentisphaera araneosa HTCC2155 TaxID=313628 RepID=A6DK93_9BACT|nr:cyclopropane-fatty-acyl-phospholipid synthase family protein [Lentisphaera araneosa]EDM27791.1 Cyclopropane-fatty-acyl-phospholipid synthase [Lentisphaera araneosa HTCC2155]